VGSGVSGRRSEKRRLNPNEGHKREPVGLTFLGFLERKKSSGVETLCDLKGCGIFDDRIIGTGKRKDRRGVKRDEGWVLVRIDVGENVGCY